MNITSPVLDLNIYTGQCATIILATLCVLQLLCDHIVIIDYVVDSRGAINRKL